MYRVFVDMKLLWVNPSFLDYRIPLYSELYKLCKGDFFLVFSKGRVPERCVARIFNELGVNAKTIDEKNALRFGKSSDFANSGISIPFPKNLYKTISSVKPDVIIAEGFFQFTPWAVVYSFFHRIPLIVSYERTAHTERNCPWWRRMYRKFIGLFVDAYVVNGSLTKEYLMSQGVNGKDVFTGSMCADSLQMAIKVSQVTFEQKELFIHMLSLNGGITYIFVGRMIKLKGVNYLLEAWRKHILKHSDDNLLIVGGGDMLDIYRNTYEAEKSIHFVGAVDYSEIYKYYAIADVFVMPTLEDNWSLVVPEAMACGLPIACSIYNGCYPELVRANENGFLFDTLNESTIIDALDKFHNVDLRKFGENSKNIEKDYNPERTAENIFKAVSYVCK